jgi:hypothetical protein
MCENRVYGGQEPDRRRAPAFAQAMRLYDRGTITVSLMLIESSRW